MNEKMKKMPYLDKMLAKKSRETISHSFSAFNTLCNPPIPVGN